MTEFQNETDAEILKRIAQENYGDGLSDDEITEMTQMALFCFKADGDNRWSGAVDNAKDDLEHVYGVEYDDLKADIRQARKTGKIPEGTGTGRDGFDDFDGLIREIRSHDCEPAELTVLYDPDGHFKDLAEELNEADVDPDEVAVGRESDLKDVSAEKRSLIDSLEESKGIDRDSLSELSLPDLRTLTGSDRSGSDPVPDPRSGDPDRSVPPGKREELAKLQEQKDFLKDKSGALAESRLSRINDRIRELRGE